MEITDGAESGLRALAGGRRAFSGNPEGGIREIFPARSSGRRSTRRSRSRARDAGAHSRTARTPAETLREYSRSRAGPPALLSHCRRPPLRRAPTDAPFVGEVGPQADVHRGVRAVPAPDRPLLPRGVRVAV